MTDAVSIVNAQADDEDEVYHLEQSLPLVIFETGDTQDRVRRGELHQALKAKYYLPKEVVFQTQDGWLSYYRTTSTLG